MPFVNYPPSLKDLFDDISNRVRKLETAQRFTAPNVATDPSNTRNGDIWLNTTSNAVNYIDGTGAVQTFTPPPYVAGKNAIINGGFDIWQRGASFTNPSGVYFADRWWVQIGGAMTFSQETTTVPTGAKNCMKVVSATALTFNINQPIETFNAIQYAGKTVTLSVQTQTSIVMPLAVQLFYSTTVDNAPGGTWTAITATSGATFNGTVGSFTQNNATYAVPSTAKSLMVIFGTNGAPSGGYTLYVGQVQLELGSTATTFSRAGGSIGGELALSQRYCQIYNTADFAGTAVASSVALVVKHLPVQMRVSPTATFPSSPYTNYILIPYVGTYTPSSLAVGNNLTTTYTFIMQGASGMTVNSMVQYNGNSQIILSAEL